MKVKVCQSTKNMEGCGEAKPIEEFRLIRGKTYTTCCKACISKYNRSKYNRKTEPKLPPRDDDFENKLVTMPWR